MFKLMPNDSHKSFYGKALWCNDENSDGQLIRRLYSYGTPVIEYNVVTGDVRRLWGGYSATTMRHVNAFMEQLYHNDGPDVFNRFGGKKWWISLPVGEWVMPESV